MNILFITAFAPCRKTAGQNYSRQLIEDLSSKHQVDLICWSRSDTDIELSDKVRILKKYEVKSKWSFLRHPRFFPLFSRRFSDKSVAYIQSIAKDYDLLYFDFSQVMVYALCVEHPFKIGMSHDVITQKFSRRKLLRPLMPWIRYSERKVLKSFNNVFTFSEKDKSFVEDNFGINTDVVSFYIEPAIIDIDFEKTEVQDYYVLYGAWGRSENQDTVLWLLNQKVNVPIKIIGGGMPKAIQDQISTYKNIEYLGFVDNPYPIIASSKGLIAPLWQGAGVKVKVIESLALGTPVIGTDVTFEGIDNIQTKEIDACISMHEFSFEESLKKLSGLTIETKKIIREKFLSKYGANKFINWLDRYCLQNSSQVKQKSKH